MSASSNDSFVDRLLGFMWALGIVFVFGVTIAITRCDKLDDITRDCDDFGKFQSNGIDKASSDWQWYECRKEGGK